MEGGGSVKVFFFVSFFCWGVVIRLFLCLFFFPVVCFALHIDFALHT